MDSENTNIPLFDGKKYSTWKLRMANRLQFMKVWSVIVDDAPEEKTTAWLEAEATAKYEVLRHLADNMLRFASMGAAKEIFQEFDNKFLQKCPKKSLFLREQLNALMFTAPLSNLLTKYEDIIEEIQMIEGEMLIFDQLYPLFRKLPEEYQTTIDAIKGWPIGEISLLQVMARLLERESELNANAKGAAPDAPTTYKPKQQQPEKDRSDRDRDRSYRPRARDSSRLAVTMKPKKNCTHCGRMGHYKKQCWYWIAECDRMPNPYSQPLAVNDEYTRRNYSYDFAYASEGYKTEDLM